MKSPGEGGLKETNRLISLKIWQVVPESRIDEYCNGYAFVLVRKDAAVKLAGISVIFRPSSHSSLASVIRVEVGIWDDFILDV